MIGAAMILTGVLAVLTVAVWAVAMTIRDLWKEGRKADAFGMSFVALVFFLFVMGYILVRAGY